MTGPVLDKTDYDVLNVVAIKKMTAAAAVAQDTGLEAGAVASRLAALATEGLVVVIGDQALPSDDATPRLEAAAEVHYAGVRDDPGIAALVDRFETLNAQFLTTMSAWQQVDAGGRKVANDHTDPEYDGRIVDRLDRLVRRLDDLLTALAGHDARFGGYTKRFEEALGAVDAGRTEMVSSPTENSIHTVWFEFHEDLLRTLGRQRAE